MSPCKHLQLCFGLTSLFCMALLNTAMSCLFSPLHHAWALPCSQLFSTLVCFRSGCHPIDQQASEVSLCWYRTGRLGEEQPSDFSQSRVSYSSSCPIPFACIKSRTPHGACKFLSDMKAR